MEMGNTAKHNCIFCNFLALKLNENGLISEIYMQSPRSLWYFPIFTKFTDQEATESSIVCC